MGTRTTGRPVIVSTVHPCCDNSGKGENGDLHPTDSGHGRASVIVANRVLFRGEGSVRIIDRPIDRTNERTNGAPRSCGPCKLVFAEGSALCLRVVTLAGVRAARCRTRITRFPVFLSGGAWCRLGFLSDTKLSFFPLFLFSASLFCLRLTLTAIFISFAPPLCFPVPSHLSLFCSRPSYLIASSA